MAKASNARGVEVEKPVGWVGSLLEVPLAEVLKRIALEEKSGDLQVIFGQTIKTVYFDHGFVVFAASNLTRDRLGESMIELGRISRHEFSLATMLMQNSRRKFGQALVQAGLMSEEELGREVALQVNRIVLSLFKVGDGIYSFDDRPSIIPVDLMVSLSIYRMMLDGIRKMVDEDTVVRNLPSMKTRVRVTAHAPFTIDIRHFHTFLLEDDFAAFIRDDRVADLPGNRVIGRFPGSREIPLERQPSSMGVGVGFWCRVSRFHDK